MADIAMLVAEEYERRMKLESKNQAGGSGTKMSLVSMLAPVQGWINVKWVSTSRLQIVDKVVEPRTQFGFAALDGFFSA